MLHLGGAVPAEGLASGLTRLPKLGCALGDIAAGAVELDGPLPEAPSCSSTAGLQPQKSNVRVRSTAGTDWTFEFTIASAAATHSRA